MEGSIASTKLDLDPQAARRGLASPDPEARGRKRRRDPLNVLALSRPHHDPSSESSTLRGRCRHRSPSRLGMMSSLSTSSRASTVSHHAPHYHHHHHQHPHHHHHHNHHGAGAGKMRGVRGSSPSHQSLAPAPSERRRLVGVVLAVRPENHRRSQSPSRSRSPAVGAGAGAEVLWPAVVTGRRRQRTQSRGRRHGLEGAFASAVLTPRSSPFGLGGGGGGEGIALREGD